MLLVMPKGLTKEKEGNWLNVVENTKTKCAAVPR